MFQPDFHQRNLIPPFCSKVQGSKTHVNVNIRLTCKLCCMLGYNQLAFSAILNKKKRCLEIQKYNSVVNEPRDKHKM